MSRQGRARQQEKARKVPSLRSITAVGEEDDWMTGTEQRSEKGRTK